MNLIIITFTMSIIKLVSIYFLFNLKHFKKIIHIIHEIIHQSSIINFIF